MKPLCPKVSWFQAKDGFSGQWFPVCFKRVKAVISSCSGLSRLSSISTQTFTAAWRGGGNVPAEMKVLRLQDLEKQTCLQTKGSITKDISSKDKHILT